MNKKALRGKSHLMIPDMQAKPGVPLEQCLWIGKYIADREPDVVVIIGDWWDMPSLSSYDAGTKRFEGRTYQADIDAGNEAFGILEKGMDGYDPTRKVFVEGNHEERIQRAINSDRKLEGVIGRHHFGLQARGWEFHKFLKPVMIDGINYCHYFPRGANGRITQTKHGAPNAQAQVVREGGSCSSGHVQGLDIKPMTLRGRQQWGLIAGSAYQHDEDYLSPQGNDHWRGIIVKHDVQHGDYNPMMVDLKYLKRRYGK